MTSVVVAFSGAWLTDPTAPTVSINASFPDRTSTSELAGTIRAYAGGRLRVISTPVSTRMFPLVLDLIDDVDVLLLDLWRGRILLLRDEAGRRIFGAFFSVAYEDVWDSDGTLHVATLTFQEVTYSEGV